MLPSFIDVKWSMLRAINTIQPLMKQDMRARADVSASWQRPPILRKKPSSFVDKKLNFSNRSTFWNSRNNFSITLTSRIRRDEEDEQAKRRPGDRDLQRTWDYMIDFCLAFRGCDL